MIAYAVQAGRREDLETFRRRCAPGLRRCLRPGDRLRVLRHPSSIHAAYNEALAWARGLLDLEALVLLHADAEVLDEHFGQRLRLLLRRRPEAAVVGVVGASRTRSLCWWDERGTRGGGWEDAGLLGGVFHAEGVPFTFHTEGDRRAMVVDGCVLALSPFAVRSLRFDPDTYSMAPWYAYDCDICLAAAAAGKEVWVMDTRVQHHTKVVLESLPAFRAANDAFVRKWSRG